MKHYVGLDLSMESTQVCVVDENGRKLVSEKVESTPEAIATMLDRHGPVERAVIETGRMSPAICLGLGDGRPGGVHRCPTGTSLGLRNWLEQGSTRRCTSNHLQRMACAA